MKTYDLEEVVGSWSTESKMEECPIGEGEWVRADVARALYEALSRLKTEIVLSDVDMDYIESHFRAHLDRARAALAAADGDE